MPWQTACSFANGPWCFVPFTLIEHNVEHTPLATERSVCMCMQHAVTKNGLKLSKLCRVQELDTSLLWTSVSSSMTLGLLLSSSQACKQPKRPCGSRTMTTLTSALTWSKPFESAIFAVSMLLRHCDDSLSVIVCDREACCKAWQVL